MWNHRWEYDKNPDEFFEVLFDLDRLGVDFRLIIAGQSFRQAPPIFAAAEKSLAHRIDHFGYASDRNEYLQLLSRANIVVSTAIHEFFGLSVLEAIAAGCLPLLPNRLSYPELLPGQTHNQHLYNSTDQLREKLIGICQSSVPSLTAALCQSVAGLSWPNLITRYDDDFAKVVAYPA